MALDSYSALQASIADFLNRDDLGTQAVDFIALAEAQINRDVRHWRMETRAVTTFDARYIALPEDWVETIRITAAPNYRALQLLSTDQLERARPFASSGPPEYYAHTAGQIELFPVPGDSFMGELLYYARVPALTDAEPVNWLLTEAPDIYLYGSLIQSAPYLKEDERAATWGAMYSAAVTRLNAMGAAAKHSGTTLRVRPPR
jgi:hypothetical protein